MRFAQAIVVAGLLISAGGCGGTSGGGSTSPTTPTAVTAPTINGSTDMVFVGQVVTFSAVGSGVTWGGDAPAVARIDSTTGVVTGIATGRVTIWAENAGGRITRLLRVLPSYNGNWSGTYELTGCQSSGGFAIAGFCGSFSLGQVLSINFSMTQTRDQVTGAFALGGIVGTLTSGVVNEDGSLPLAGTAFEGTSTVRLQSLRATSPSAGTMNGTFDQEWSSTTLSGTGRLSCRIRSVTRTSGAPALFASPTAALSLEDAIRSVLKRQ